MAAYYNEYDAEAAEWLRQLIAAGEIAPGDVDERSIEDVRPDELAGYTQCHFFAGVGVWSRALRLAGWPDDRAVWTGSCPCQPFSAAGKGAGFTDERHLWPSFFHLIKVCRPVSVFGEQVAGARGLTWLDLISSDLEAMDYAVGAVPFTAAGVGAPHIRERLYWVADANGGNPGPEGLQRRGQHRLLPAGRGDLRQAGGRPQSSTDGLSGRPASAPDSFWGQADWIGGMDGRFRPVEPGTFPLVDGSPGRLGRVRGYGNALVAQQAQAFIEAYLKR